MGTKVKSDPGQVHDLQSDFQHRWQRLKCSGHHPLPSHTHPPGGDSEAEWSENSLMRDGQLNQLGQASPSLHTSLISSDFCPHQPKGTCVRNSTASTTGLLGMRHWPLLALPSTAAPRWWVSLGKPPYISIWFLQAGNCWVKLYANEVSYLKNLGSPAASFPIQSYKVLNQPCLVEATRYFSFPVSLSPKHA